MKRIIDLSHPITSGMPVYPGDPEVHIQLVHGIPESGYNVSEISMGVHTGTHVDAPIHCLYSKSAVDSLPLDALVGWAEVLDLSDKPSNSDITAADLDRFADRVIEGSRVLIRTDWSKHYGKSDFYESYPGLSEGAAMWLTSRKVKLIGLEQPSVHTKYHLEVHKALMLAGVVLIESLANLDKLSQSCVYMIALPLNLIGQDGSPVRVVALEGVSVAE